MDILDESDAILSSSDQLIFTHGASFALPDLQVRTDVVQELLRLLHTEEQVQAILRDPNVAESAVEPSRPGGAPAVRLLAGVHHARARGRA